jgi:transcriptional regulator with XRE-family HTH domain
MPRPESKTSPADRAAQLALGETIASLRDRASLSRQELAAALGIDAVTLHRWEAGDRAPPLWRLPELAAALRTTPQVLADTLAATIPKKIRNRR